MIDERTGEAMKTAIEMEKSGHRFFMEASNNVFTRILEEEKNHYDLIQAEIDSINHSGFWFDVHELRMDSQF